MANLTEQIRSAIALVAVLGAIGLGIRYPQVYGQAATVTLSSAIAGYYGLSQAASKE